MADDRYVCDLCGLNVEVQGFELETRQGNKHFCCEGCKGIFQMLHENEVINQQHESQKK